MSQRFIDDKTGEIITADRSYQIGIWQGDEPREPRDYANVDDAIDAIRAALTKEKADMPLQIIVKTWFHSPHVQASWQ